MKILKRDLNLPDLINYNFSISFCVEELTQEEEYIWFERKLNNIINNCIDALEYSYDDFKFNIFVKYQLNGYRHNFIIDFEIEGLDRDDLDNILSDFIDYFEDALKTKFKSVIGE